MRLCSSFKRCKFEFTFINGKITKLFLSSVCFVHWPPLKPYKKKTMISLDSIITLKTVKWVWLNSESQTNRRICSQVARETTFEEIFHRTTWKRSILLIDSWPTVYSWRLCRLRIYCKPCFFHYCQQKRVVTTTLANFPAKITAIPYLNIILKNKVEFSTFTTLIMFDVHYSTTRSTKPKKKIRKKNRHRSFTFQRWGCSYLTCRKVHGKQNSPKQWAWPKKCGKI